MKRLLFIAASIFLFANISHAQEYYTINVGTFLEAKTKDFDEIRSHGLVYSYQMDGNISKVFIGGFSDRLRAESTLTAIKSKGYSAASIQTRLFNEGKTVTVIQIATRNIQKPIDWARFEKNGQLYAILNGTKVKVLTGVFRDMATAKETLSSIHKAGYKDAFIKNVNSTLLVKISSFETGIKKNLIPLSFDNNTRKGAPDKVIAPKDDEPTAYDTRAKGGLYPRGTDKRDTPTAYDTRVKTVKSDPVFSKNTEIAEKSGIPLPAISTKVKRRSALELQKVLKIAKYYDNGLDGYYGKGTAKGYQNALNQDSELRKYTLLAKYAVEAAPARSNNRLQDAIDRFLVDPSSINTIESAKEPVALAYQAYYLFTKLGASGDVNRLMSNALRKGYAGKKLKNKPPFDFNATYAYEGINQLVLHLFYVHAAPGNTYEVPCWLYEKHPREAANAQGAVASFGSEDFKSASCAQALNWNEIKLLKAIAVDLDAGKANAQKLASAANKRSQVLFNPKELRSVEIKIAEDWNEILWSNLNAWSNRDPLHLKSVNALKIAYFQSAVRLEDYFMDQGHSAKDAKGYTLVVLKTLVGEYLSRFV